MTLIEHEIAKLHTERLRELARHELPGIAAAARAELNRRPEARAETELRDRVFPPNSSK